MNRENKRKQYEKGYYKTHPCTDSFTCKVCGRPVVAAGAGSDHRNHCPNCLSSLHLDIEPGDRQADCGGIMDPVGVWVRKNGEWAIIHRCRRCGQLSSNRVAADDNPMKLMSIAMKPLTSPPFGRRRVPVPRPKITTKQDSAMISYRPNHSPFSPKHIKRAAEFLPLLLFLHAVCPAAIFLILVQLVDLIAQRHQAVAQVDIFHHNRVALVAVAQPDVVVRKVPEAADTVADQAVAQLLHHLFGQTEDGRIRLVLPAEASPARSPEAISTPWIFCPISRGFLSKMPIRRKPLASKERCLTSAIPRLPAPSRMIFSPRLSPRMLPISSYSASTL